MTDHANNPPVYPIVELKPLEYTSEGMTLRDYFAAKAMQGLVAGKNETPDLCEIAYEVADEMLKARGADD